MNRFKKIFGGSTAPSTNEDSKKGERNSSQAPAERQTQQSLDLHGNNSVRGASQVAHSRFEESKEIIVPPLPSTARQQGRTNPHHSNSKGNEKI